MKRTILKLSLRLLTLGILLVISQFIYKAYFLEQDLIDHSPIANEIESLDDSVQIVYFGESSNFTYSDYDIDKARISDMVSRYYPNKVFGTVNKGALHAENYLQLMKNLPADAPIETVIVTMNLRSFNIQWIDSNLETSLEKSMVLLGKYPDLYNRFRLSFKGYDITSKPEREKNIRKHLKNDPLYIGSPQIKTSNAEWEQNFMSVAEKNMEAPVRQLGMHYIRTYGFNINTSKNPRIKDFDKIVRYAQKKNWNIVFNLLAENTDKAEEIVGDDLVDLIRSNRDILVQRYEEQGAIVVDNLDNVRNKCFLDQDWTTEHYNEVGRTAIAFSVGQELKKIYPESYSPFNLKKTSNTSFFNDCEGGTVWGQIKGFSSDVAYSGNHSSKTDQANQYSVAFTRPISTFPKNTLETIAVSFYVYQEHLSPEPKVILECLKGKEKILWTSKTINNPELAEKKWVQYSTTFPYNEKVENSDLIKIYVWNPGKEVVYIDDFSIEFK